MNCMEVWGGNQSTIEHLARPGLDVWVYSSGKDPAANGGGDLHLVSSCASGRITRTLIAEVCAPEPVFASVADRLRDSMMRNLNSIRQVRIVKQIYECLQASADDGAFASLLVSTYFAPTRTLSICNIGQSPPMIYRASTAKWSLLESKRISQTDDDIHAGVVSEGEFQHAKVKLDVGDIVVSASNALAECRDRDGQMIGTNGLLARVRRLYQSQPNHLAAQLTAALRDEHPANLASDDTTLLVARGSNTGVKMRDNLLAPLRLFRSASDATSVKV